VANVLCVVELHDGKALPVSLEVLGQARRVSTELGATLYAVVALPRAPSYGEDDLIAQLAAHGADKVVIATDETLGGGDDLRWGTHGGPLGAACDLLSPSLLLFGQTPPAREVAARAAARIGAAFLVDAWIEAREGKLWLWEGAGKMARAIDGELEFPVVATLPPGRYEHAHGDDEAEVEVITTAGRGSDYEELGWQADARPRALVLTDGWQHGDAARVLAQSLGGRADEGTIGPQASRLVITLGPHCPAAEARVRLGDDDGDSDYAVSGDAGVLATDLARAVDGDDA
jgi:electron transfer flavoprotein alpha subunit